MDRSIRIVRQLEQVLESPHDVPRADGERKKEKKQLQSLCFFKEKTNVKKRFKNCIFLGRGVSIIRVFSLFAWGLGP
jgi:hypothetical protein